MKPGKMSFLKIGHFCLVQRLKRVFSVVKQNRVCLVVIKLRSQLLEVEQRHRHLARLPANQAASLETMPKSRKLASLAQVRVQLFCPPCIFVHFESI